MGTGSRNFIGSTDFPSERSGTHFLKKVLYVFSAISTPNLYAREQNPAEPSCSCSNYPSVSVTGSLHTHRHLSLLPEREGRIISNLGECARRHGNH